LNTASESASHPPPALERFDEIAARLGNHQPVVCLDFDGTLAEIAPRPELAKMTAAMRTALERVAQHWSTAIISGRSLRDVRESVAIEGLVYAGNHGLEIEGPPGSNISRVLASEYRAAVADSAARLSAMLSNIDGVLIEDKDYSLSVHYRLADSADLDRIEAAVDDVADACPALEKKSGKMVLELRPSIDWDKGRALTWLLAAIDHRGLTMVPVYIGDDVTDEDAFAAIRDHGLGILVSEQQRPTAASYRLRDPGEVCVFLQRLADLGDPG